MTNVEYRAFEAYREHMGKHFIVRGTVVVQNAGYRVTLERVVPQGINPDNLILKLVFQPDFEARSEQKVESSEEWGESEPPTCTTVTFQVEGLLEGVEPPPTITKIGDVH